MNEHFHDFPNIFIFLCGLARLECNEIFQIIYSKLTSKNDSTFQSNPDVVPAVSSGVSTVGPSGACAPLTFSLYV